jgi:hypothetical protein
MMIRHLAVRLSSWSVGLACLIGIWCPAAPAPAAAAEHETAKEIVAVQIRKQGFPCDDPQDAKRDLQASKPDEAVWVLQCENATYRVRFVPDMAAQVERVE